ncbi:MAG: hypothetical protein MST09_05410 [Spirochaetia bacterium]|nr:hypothetical protein [Spirochaetia bacterium]
MGQHYEEQILQFESQNDFQTASGGRKLYIKLKKFKSHRKLCFNSY